MVTSALDIEEEHIGGYQIQNRIVFQAQGITHTKTKRIERLT